MNSDHQEGYADGLAGAGMQLRLTSGSTYRDYQHAMKYEAGFTSGSIDRRAMLQRRNAAQAWMDGLCDEENG